MEGIYIHDMRDIHYIILCHSKKHLTIVFKCDKHNRISVSVSKYYVMNVALIIHELLF